MTYTIWLCCNQFEQEDTREDAISMAASMMNGDGHIVLAVEGPAGEDLMPEAQAEEDRRSQQWRQRSSETHAQLLGYVEVKGPTGKWWGREYCYSPERRDKVMAALIKAYGQDRVRWVDKPAEFR